MPNENNKTNGRKPTNYKMMRKLFFALMAVAAIAMTGTFAGCEEKNPVVELEPQGEGIKPPTDTDGANQNRWGLVPERIPLTVTSTENDEE